MSWKLNGRNVVVYSDFHYNTMWIPPQLAFTDPVLLSKSREAVAAALLGTW